MGPSHKKSLSEEKGFLMQLVNLFFIKSDFIGQYFIQFLQIT